MEAQIGAWYDSGVNSEEDMSPNFIGTELYETGKLTKDKMLINKKKQKSRNWIPLKNLEHVLPTSKIRTT